MCRGGKYEYVGPVWSTSGYKRGLSSRFTSVPARLIHIGLEADQSRDLWAEQMMGVRLVAVPS